MRNLGLFLLLAAAFLAGTAVCGTPTLLAPRALPHTSSIPASGFGSAAEVYASIPHRRTVFDPSETTLTSEINNYLQLMFHTLDEATIVRVKALEAEGNRDQFAEAYLRLQEFTADIHPPRELAEYHQHVVLAMHAQASVVADSDSNLAEINQNPQVAEASTRLQRAYSILSQQYPHQNERTQRAFFDYHCALDYL